jgi:hypothetical protein
MEITERIVLISECEVTNDLTVYFRKAKETLKE